MTGTNVPVRRSTATPILVLLLAAAALSPCAAGQTRQDLGPAKEAIATLSRFPAAVNAAVAEASDLARRPASASIGVDCCAERFLWWCTRPYRWSFTTRFPKVQEQLSAALVQVEQQSRRLPSSFQPVNDWLLKTLPAFNVRFAAASEQIRAVADEIRAGEGPTAAQQAKVASLFDQLSTRLAEDAGQLQAGLGALAKFQQGQVAAALAVRNARDSLQTSARTAVDVLDDAVRRQPCGQEEARAQLNEVWTRLDRSVAASDAAFGRLGDLTREADDALSVLMGTVLDLVNQYDFLSEEVKQAQASELGSVFQTFHLDVATDSWNELAAYAAAHVRP